MRAHLAAIVTYLVLRFLRLGFLVRNVFGSLVLCGRSLVGSWGLLAVGSCGWRRNYSHREERDSSEGELHYRIMWNISYFELGMKDFVELRRLGSRELWIYISCVQGVGPGPAARNTSACWARCAWQCTIAIAMVAFPVRLARG